MKRVITAQQLTAMGLSTKVDTFLRTTYPTWHAFDFTPAPKPDGSNVVTCMRDGVSINLADHAGEKIEDLLPGCLPDLTLSELVEIAQDRGEQNLALTEMASATEPLDKLWAWLEGRI